MGLDPYLERVRIRDVGSLKPKKTKYFRLRLSDKVGTERPETDLRQTDERKMKIQCFRAPCAGQTAGQTE